MSTYKFAGVSTLDGKVKARFANDQMRVKVLAKNGHTDIDIIELEHPMTKEDAVAFLLKINFDQGNSVVRAALEAESDKRQEKPAKAAKAPTAKKATPAKPAAKAKAKPTMDSIKAKAKAAKAKETSVTKAEVLAQLEDAPF